MLKFLGTFAKKAIATSCIWVNRPPFVDVLCAPCPTCSGSTSRAWAAVQRRRPAIANDHVCSCHSLISLLKAYAYSCKPYKRTCMYAYAVITHTHRLSRHPICITHKSIALSLGALECFSQSSELRDAAASLNAHRHKHEQTRAAASRPLCGERASATPRAGGPPRTSQCPSKGHWRAQQRAIQQARARSFRRQR